ncbi:hypothetical protein [Shouchella lehensis]|uniref:Uncharacterized protein n=1 Tax=Shouchella lehensis G1 TaxID=1246626 RepID=A0A060M1B8_9BACI|nr:hypothetical protein [Shouchella lehensis]AIC93869.1 hypothetical protein BleG1_1286 [Shouchella lehensis G1]
MKKKLVKILHDNVKQLNEAFLNGHRAVCLDEKEKAAFEKDALEMNERGAEVVSAKISGDILNVMAYEQQTQVDYIAVIDRLLETRKQSVYGRANDAKTGTI